MAKELEYQPHLDGMSKREILESQGPMVLIELRKAMLNKLSDLESEIHLVNDILGGYGFDETEYTEFDHEVNIVRGDN